MASGGVAVGAVMGVAITFSKGVVAARTTRQEDDGVRRVRFGKGGPIDNDGCREGVPLLL